MSYLTDITSDDEIDICVELALIRARAHIHASAAVCNLNKTTWVYT